MKKRAMSLLLCLVMVFSLLPTFSLSAAAADGVETTDGYAQAGTRTSWNMNQVQDWTNNYITYAPYADDGRLYVKVGDNYYEVTIAADPDYHGSLTQKTIGSSFMANMASSEGDYFWEQDNTEWCYVDGDGNMHQLYYNSYYKENGLTGNNYELEAYYYANPTDQGVNTKGSGTAYATANANFQAAVNSGRVILLNSDGTPDLDNNKERWRFGYASGWHSTSLAKTLKISPFYHTANSKYAMYYEIGGTRYYMVRNTTSATNPATTAWSGKLYYKVDENMIIDPETVPVTDDDPGENTVTVQDHNTITNPARANDNGFKLSKELSYNNGSDAFDLTMEAYSTVNVDKTNVTEKIPTDFIVVVDQSGSMDYTDMPVSYDKTIKQVDLETIGAAAEETPGSTNANGYYYKADDGNYYRVYPVQDYLFHYFAPNYWYVGDIIDRLGTNLGWFMGSTDSTSTFQNQFYFREEINGEGHYQPITMTVTGRALRYDIVFKYNSELPGASNPVTFNRNEKSYSGATNSPWYKNLITGNTMTGGALYWVADAAVKAISGDDTWYTYAELGVDTGMFVNYPMYERKVGYTKLVYRDVNGVEHVVPTSSGLEEAEFCDGSGNAVTTKEATTRMWYNNLYTYHKATNTDRVTAVKYALNQFLTALANEKDTKNKTIGSVDNRVAIVGFSSGGYNTTEVMTGESINAGGGVTKSTADNNPTTYYGGALLPATNNGQLGVVNPKLTAAVNSITANGGTQPELGLNMAYKILNNRSETNYTMVTGEGDTVKRNTIVIFFTDGRPGDYKESNQYSEANEVVQEALNIKNLQSDGVDLNTTIFSIGVFGESDGNPLTYNANNEYAYDNQGNRVRISSMSSGNWEYLGGWVETYNGYCLRRQWRAHNADYTPEANDTIFDYMSVVSSNYPDAENYIAPAWLNGNFEGTDPNVGDYVEATEGVRHIDTAESTNKYYRMASNQDTLVKAFREAVTIAGSVVEGSSGATSLDDMARFEDKIDTENFDVSEATYSVYWQPIKVLDTAVPTVGYEGTTMIADNGDAVLKVDHQPVNANGVIDYSGFNYSENYVSKMKDEGYKLVVKVEGLKPLKYNQQMKSNADPSATEFACGIYPAGSSEARISIKSPVVTVFKHGSTYVVDFNAPLIVAHEVEGDIVNPTNRNGAFSKNGTDAVYKLRSGTQQSAAGTTVAVNSAYTQADTATITGRHVEDGEGAPVSTQEVTVIPASSIYYDDGLTTPIEIGDGSGYNANVNETHATANLAKGVHTFTFCGTGIDVYCTTANDGGMIQAKLETGAIQTVRNYTEETTRYNVPTVSFRDLAPGVQHTLTLNILGSSNYKLDGIRVYNPVQDQSLYNTKPEEQYAAFVNLRDALVNDNQTSGDVTIRTDTTQEDPISTLVGALFVDDSSKLKLQRQQVDSQTGDPIVDENGDPVMGWAYTSLFEAYKANSPKHEIYLNNGQMIIFQLTSDACGGKLWIGLSAPDAGANTGTVAITTDHTENVSVTSGVDMYYPIDLGESTTVTIANNGSNLISVTNLKITGVADNYTAANAQQSSGASASAFSFEDVVPMVFAPVTMQTVRMAANLGVDPEAVVTPDEPDTPDTPDEPDTPDTPDEPDVPDVPDTPDTPDQPDDPKPGWDDNAWNPVNILQNLFQMLLNALSGLFSGLGNW